MVYVPLKVAETPGARLAALNTAVFGPGRSLVTTMLVKVPGASEAAAKTVVLGTGRLLTTTILVRVTLPVLLTLPEKVSNWPGATGCAGQALVTLMPGVKTSEHVVWTELLTVRGKVVNWSTPWATNVAVLARQGLEGTQLPLKFAI